MEHQQITLPDGRKLMSNAPEYRDYLSQVVAQEVANNTQCTVKHRVNPSTLETTYQIIPQLIGSTQVVRVTAAGDMTPADEIRHVTQQAIDELNAGPSSTQASTPSPTTLN